MLTRTGSASSDGGGSPGRAGVTSRHMLATDGGTGKASPKEVKHFRDLDVVDISSGKGRAAAIVKETALVELHAQDMAEES